MTPPMFQPGRSTSIALPVKVLDADGAVLAEGVASLERPAEFKLMEYCETVFVRLIWPSGKTETQRVVLLSSATAKITFSDAKIAHNEWSAWAIPRLNARTSLADSDRPKDMTILSYANVWLRVWRFDRGQWSTTPMVPRMQYKSDVARQIDLDLDAKPHLLQIGGSGVPWRFVALPGAGPCRVLLTPNHSKDPRSDSLKVVVTSFRADAETLLEFLARDEVQAANTMANSEAMAVALFEEKFADPIAAVAGAYYLLRIENWERVPLTWWANLSSNFNWIPDTAILHCVRLLHAGLEDEHARSEAMDLFKACLDRGWPVYEEGLQLLQEASSLLRNIASREDAEYFARVETLVTAKTWAGAALSFYGREPAKPSAVLWVGMPNAPRRRHHATPEWRSEFREQNLLPVQDMNEHTASLVSRQMSSLLFAQEFAPKKFTPGIASDLPRDQMPSIEVVGRVIGRLARGYREEAAKANPPRATNEPRSDDWMLLGDIGG